MENNNCASNIVPRKELRKTQKWALTKLSDAVANSAGPFGSTTQIINNNAVTEYTKDGHTIISSIKFNCSIEDSIQKEITELTRYIVKTVGDGTTSAVLLSKNIFDKLCNIEMDDAYQPHLIVSTFKKITEEIKEEIYKNKRELTLRDIYDIAMICTNSDTTISSAISDIYKTYGLGVAIDVKTSFTEDSYINSYDGLTLEEGYSDAAYINKIDSGKNNDDSGMCIIDNAKIYAFQDPVDTPEMIGLFEKIVYENIMKPISEAISGAKTKREIVPTVIIAPKFSTDMSATFEEIASTMYKFNNNMDIKPPLLVIRGTGANKNIYYDIARLCGAKLIRKYIDPVQQEKEIKEGKAAGIDNILDFCGYAEKVKSSSTRTTFINPRDMFEYDDQGNIKLDENGERVLSLTYHTQVNFLKSEYKKAQEEGEDISTVADIRNRILSLESNTVDYLVGGLTTTDRDSARDLAEDAVKNIRSAAKSGIGYGANYEGLIASINVAKRYNEATLKYRIAELISNAYRQTSAQLYATSRGSKDAYKVVDESIEMGCPMNLNTSEFDGSVLSSIESDPTILNAISKIITVMFTTNQSLVQSPLNNVYAPLD